MISVQVRAQYKNNTSVFKSVHVKDVYVCIQKILDPTIDVSDVSKVVLKNINLSSIIT